MDRYELGYEIDCGEISQEEKKKEELFSNFIQSIDFFWNSTEIEENDKIFYRQTSIYTRHLRVRDAFRENLRGLDQAMVDKLNEILLYTTSLKAKFETRHSIVATENALQELNTMHGEISAIQTMINDAKKLIMDERNSNTNLFSRYCSEQKFLWHLLQKQKEWKMEIRKWLRLYLIAI
jgi:hypothetical protein